MTKEQDTFEAIMKVYEKFVPVFNGVQDSLMKAHETVLHIADEFYSAADKTAEGIMKVSEFLDAYGEEVWQNLQKMEDAAFPEKTVNTPESPVQDKVKDVTDKPVEDMSREEKIAYIVRGYALNPEGSTAQGIKDTSDSLLTSAVQALKAQGK